MAIRERLTHLRFVQLIAARVDDESMDSLFALDAVGRVWVRCFADDLVSGDWRELDPTSHSARDQRNVPPGVVGFQHGEG